jgi:hypothetical protein
VTTGWEMKSVVFWEVLLDISQKMELFVVNPVRT